MLGVFMHQFQQYTPIQIQYCYSGATTSSQEEWRFVDATGWPDYPDGYGDGYGDQDGLNNGAVYQFIPDLNARPLPHEDASLVGEDLPHSCASRGAPRTSHHT